MIKWLRRALITLAVLIPSYWFVSVAIGYSVMATLQEQASEIDSESTKAIVESSVSRYIMGSISGLLQNLAISCLCLFAAHKLEPIGNAAEVFD